MDLAGGEEFVLFGRSHPALFGAFFRGGDGCAGGGVGGVVEVEFLVGEAVAGGELGERLGGVAADAGFFFELTQRGGGEILAGVGRVRRDLPAPPVGDEPARVSHPARGRCLHAESRYPEEESWPGSRRPS